MVKLCAYRTVAILMTVGGLLVPGSPSVALGNELFDIVFVIDGSGSIPPSADGAFTLQKEGIANCLVGERAFIPHNGTCAVALIQLGTKGTIQIGGEIYNGVTLHLPLTIIDDAAEAQSLAHFICPPLGQPQNILQGGQGTPLDDALEATRDILRNYAQGTQHFVVVSTDGDPNNVQEALAAANEVRAGDPVPNYRPQGKICSG